MKRIIALVSFILATQANIKAQLEYEVLYEIETNADYISFDNLLNVYTIKGTEMQKWDKNGQFQFRYSDKQLGDIGAVDVTFPLRPLLTYPGINYIAMLDNTLSNNRGNINLLNHNIALGTVACSSVQNHFWIYDAMNFKLLRTNENFKPVIETGNLAQILRIDKLEPNFMAEFANRVYLNNPSTGILVFDIFGTYIRTIPILGLHTFQLQEGELNYFQNGSLFRYHLQEYKDVEIPIPQGAKDAWLQKNRIAVQQPGRVVVYQMK